MTSNSNRKRKNNLLFKVLEMLLTLLMILLKAKNNKLMGMKKCPITLVSSHISKNWKALKK